MVTAHEAAHQWWGNMVAPGKGPGGNLVSEGTATSRRCSSSSRSRALRARIEFAGRSRTPTPRPAAPTPNAPSSRPTASRDGDQTVTYDKTGFVLWMLLNQMGREPMLAGIRGLLRDLPREPRPPGAQDFLATLRPHAADPAAFDAFTRQWFFEVVVPEYRFSGVSRVKAGEVWKVSGTLQNVGTGIMPVEVAVVKGERFKPDGSTDPDYRESRTTLTLGAGDSRAFTLDCGFEPGKVLVDPDLKVLQLR